ncbi:helix-turn-helix domain-containing protein [Ammoniphilus sp. 3BR4]|uniref:helix-turn-helix domain-containing protein n=1 Tax=Ammoniphilus sp. 3BR4 TaxID=3158265 RepID=UPI0034657F77
MLTEDDADELEEGFCKVGYAAKRLGVSPQTVKRYCESGRIQGAKKTLGGHWRIPQSVFCVSEEQQAKAKKTMQRIDKLNTLVGEVEDEFHL